MSGRLILPARLLIAAGLLLLTAAPALAQGPGFFDLGTLPTGSFSEASAISPSGQVVGTGNVLVDDESHSHAFYWSARSGMVDLGVLPGATESAALAINGRNQIAGISGSPEVPHAVRFTVNAAGSVIERRDLGLLPGGTYSVARAINHAGFIVGEADAVVEGEQVQRAFIWTQAAGMVDLGTLGGAASTAFGINNANPAQVVGIADDDRQAPEGFLFTLDATGTQVVQRTSLGVPPGTDNLNPSPVAVNNAGTVVGTDDVFIPGLANPVPHSLTWKSGQVAVPDLGTLPGGFQASAAGINNAGQVVGSADTAGGILNRGFFWSAATGIRDLSFVTGGEFLEITHASGINDAGQIAATGHLGDGPDHAFLLRLCPADVGRQVIVRRSAFSVDRATGRWIQVVRIVNAGPWPIRGRMVLALDNLGSNATLLNPTGATACSAPTGSPFVEVDTGAADLLQPGQTASVTLVFANPSRRPIAYRPRVLAGGVFP